MATENASIQSESPNVNVSMDGNLETGPLERDFINDIDSCANIESHEQVDPLTGEEATTYNENLSSALKDPESSSKWGSLNIMSESKTRSGTKLGKFKPKPNAQTRKVQQISNAPVEDESIPSFQPTDESLGPTYTISEFHAIEDSTNLNEAAGRSSKRLKKKSSKALELVDEPDDDITNDAIVHVNNRNNNVILLILGCGISFDHLYAMNYVVSL